jgi:hypothetical protein
MPRRRFQLVLGIGILLAAGLTVGVARSARFQKWYSPPVLALPTDSEVAEVRASLREFQGAFPATPEFVVPPEQVPIVLDWLRPGEHLRKRWNPLPGDELGEIVIRTIDGREIRLVFYWTGKNGVVFTLEGENQFIGRGINSKGRCIDGGMCLWNAIEEAYKASRR